MTKRARKDKQPDAMIKNVVDSGQSADNDVITHMSNVVSSTRQPLTQATHANNVAATPPSQGVPATSTSSNLTLTMNSSQLTESFIIIEFCSSTIGMTHIEKMLIGTMMNYINFLISAKTNVNYVHLPVRNYTITIPIYVYSEDETKMKPVDLIQYRYNTICNYFNAFDWKLANRVILWTVRAMAIIGFDISNSFTIYVKTTDEARADIINNKKYNIPLKPSTFNIRKPNLVMPTITRKELSDHSMITELVDPYLNDYGLFVDLSCPFSEMGLSYNALHLYEHMLTKPWEGLSGKELIEMNGATSPTGISYVYTIHQTHRSLMEYFNASFKWACESRSEHFWDQHAKQIQLETLRTISETRVERSLSNFARSDYSAYKNGYNLEIFKYWSNKPFNIFIAGPKHVGLDYDMLSSTVSKYVMRDVKCPSELEFDNIPSEVLISKQYSEKYTLKIDTKKIVDMFLHEGLNEHALYGVDCFSVYGDTDASQFNTVLYPLVYLNKYCSEDELKAFVVTHLLPRTTQSYGMTSVDISKNYGEGMIEQDMIAEVMMNEQDEATCEGICENMSAMSLMRNNMFLRI